MVREPVQPDAVTAPQRRAVTSDDLILTVHKRVLAPLDDDGWRRCARTYAESDRDCTNKFKPTPERVNTQSFCSDLCAQVSFYENHGMPAHAMALLKSRVGETEESAGVDGPKSIVRGRRRRRASSVEADVKYGPMRDVHEIVKTVKDRVRVRYDVCDHEASLKPGMTRGRCRACRRKGNKRR